MNINSEDLWNTIEHFCVHGTTDNFYFSNADDIRLLLRSAATHEALPDTKISRYCTFIAVGLGSQIFASGNVFYPAPEYFPVRIMENAYKILNIIKELKGNHTGYYYDKICDVAERKYGFENSTTDNYLDYCINNGFITSANSRGKISYRLAAVPDITIDGDDSLTSTIVENPQLVTPGPATPSSSLNEGGHRQSSKFSEKEIA